jgi:hypothetical protein
MRNISILLGVIACFTILVALTGCVADGVYNTTYNATVYTHTQPPYTNGVNKDIALVRNDSAINPTWQQVKNFVSEDWTDQILYSYTFVCGDFAERLYNNAEAQGIRTAFVAITFSDGDPPHGLNAFETTDKGLVYIDSTGKGQSYLTIIYSSSSNKELGIPLSYDKIGYVEVGKPYGIISLNVNYGTEYSDYTKWQADKTAFDAELHLYNNKVMNYNDEVTRFNTYPSYGWASLLHAEQSNLEVEGNKIEVDAGKLGGFWLPQGTVSSIELYW